MENKFLKIPFAIPQASLLKNSYYMLLGELSITAFGFFFWIISARFYPPHDIGISATLITSSQIIAAFSILGLNYGLVKYLAEGDDKIDMINSSLNLVVLSSVVFTTVFVLGLNELSPKLGSIRSDSYLLASFIALSIIFSVFTLQNYVFIGSRFSKYSFFQMAIYNILRLPLPAILAPFGILGLISSWTLPLAISLSLSNFFLIPKVCPGFRFHLSIKKKIVQYIMLFSAGNYLSGVIGSIPGMIMPLITINILGPEQTAYFFIAYSIGAIFILIPATISTVLFAEGSNDQTEFNQNVTKSLKLIFLLLTPCLIILYYLGDEILMLFGKSYSQNSANLALLIAISSIPSAVNLVYMTIKRVKSEIRGIIYINLLIAAIVVSSSYVFMKAFGLNGIGFGWIIGNSIVALITGFYILANFTNLRKFIQEDYRPV